jgi:hypothetical protein
MNQSGKVHLGGGAPSSGDLVHTRRRRWDIPTVKINGAMAHGAYSVHLFRLIANRGLARPGGAPAAEHLAEIL